MKGQPGSVVEFLVKKVNTSDTLKVKVRRELIHLPDIKYAGMIAPKTGYILQTGFTEGVADTMRVKVNQLKAQGMEKLILDLRGNGGGLLKEAVEIVSIFVPENSLVVTSRDRDGKDVEVYRTQKAPLAEKMKLVVLVDGGSASSSEIVSGALQDLDRATIMGTRTFGKGLVQSVRPLPFGGQLKLTVAKYYTP
ncbi:MAG TPA: peptidase S41, partial [Rikenellaceae bacterium]|nr:peptidase S41 [Rikenellaceae bacterium]